MIALSDGGAGVREIRCCSADDMSLEKELARSVFSFGTAKPTEQFQ